MGSGKENNLGLSEVKKSGNGKREENRMERKERFNFV